MKTSELRIGNILTDGKFDFNVESIEQNMVWGYIYECIKPERIEDYYDEGVYHFDIENIEGIPLTEEWLLKFGWEWDIFYQGYFGHNYTMFPNNEKGWRISYAKRKYDIIVENIEYVHQLQNLYFALTGEELEIK